MDPRGRLRGVVDGGLAVGLLALYGAQSVCAAMRNGEDDNTIAYLLPTANLVVRGQLSLPQLGSQFGLDRFWLLNSPMMGLGAAPFYEMLGVNRTAYALGLVVLSIFNLVVFGTAIRRALGLRGWSLPVFLSFAFLGNRLILSELYNARYCLLEYGMMTLAYLPLDRTGRRPPAWWQWLAAGALPLIHPALLAAWAFWLAWELGRVLVLRRQGGPSRPPSRLEWLGYTLWLLTLAVALAWYGRPGPLLTQFWPHLRYGNFRTARLLAGMLDVPASPLFAIPSLITNAACVGLALGIILACGVSRLRNQLMGVLRAAIPIALFLAVDLVRGFPGYFCSYYLGLAPCLLFAVPARWYRVSIAVLAALALANAAVAYRLDFQPVRWHSTPRSIAFLVNHTEPGEQIVTGPPFVLASSYPELPGHRRIVRVVPNPYFLASFSIDRFQNEIRELAHVYVGERRWYENPSGQHIRESRREPLFAAAAIETATWEGREVIIARQSDRAASPAMPFQRQP